MKLTEKALTTLQNDRDLRLDLAKTLGFSEVWINKLIQNNKQNGPLTTIAAIEIIKESGLTESEVLEQSPVVC